MVTVLFILDTAHQVCACHTIYQYTMSFRDPEAIGRVVWSVPVFHTLEPILALVAQLLRLLNRVRWPVVLATVLLAISSFAFCMFSAVTVYKSEKWGDGAKYNWVVTTWLASGAACDILIASAITYSLLLSRSGFKATDRIISKLIIWTVATGANSALTATLQLACSLALPNTALPVGLDLVLAKLYTNSLLAFLNRRKSPITRGRYNSATQEDIQLTSLNLSNLPDHAIEPIPVTAHGTILQSPNPKTIPRSNFVLWPKQSMT